jgi:hypothetical protein
MKIEETECSETSAYKIQTPANYPEESIKHSEHCESLIKRTYMLLKRAVDTVSTASRDEMKLCA